MQSQVNLAGLLLRRRPVAGRLAQDQHGATTCPLPRHQGGHFQRRKSGGSALLGAELPRLSQGPRPDRPGCGEGLRSARRPRPGGDGKGRLPHPVPPRPARPNLRAPADAGPVLASNLSPFRRVFSLASCPPLLASVRQGGAMPGPGRDRIRPPRSGCSPAPASPALHRRSTDLGRSRTPGYLESSFSIEAILARPKPRAPAASPRSVSARAASGIWTAPSRSLVPVLPGACTATLLPAYLSAGLYQPFLQLPAAPGLRVAHLCGLQGLGVTGMRWPGPSVQQSRQGS